MPPPPQRTFPPTAWTSGKDRELQPELVPPTRRCGARRRRLRPQRQWLWRQAIITLLIARTLTDSTFVNVWPERQKLDQEKLPL